VSVKRHTNNRIIEFILK